MSGGVGDIELSEQTALQADEEDGSIHATISLPGTR